MVGPLPVPPAPSPATRAPAPLFSKPRGPGATPLTTVTTAWSLSPPPRPTPEQSSQTDGAAPPLQCTASSEGRLCAPSSLPGSRGSAAHSQLPRATTLPAPGLGCPWGLCKTNSPPPLLRPGQIFRRHYLALRTLLVVQIAVLPFHKITSKGE